jgi:hypothetical protein
MALGKASKKDRDIVFFRKRPIFRPKTVKIAQSGDDL